MLTYLFRSGVSEIREIIFKIYLIVCPFEWVEALLHLHRCFEHIVIKPSRAYVANGVTDVKDYTSNNVTLNLSLRLQTK